MAAGPLPTRPLRQVGGGSRLLADKRIWKQYPDSSCLSVSVSLVSSPWWFVASSLGLRMQCSVWEVSGQSQSVPTHPTQPPGHPPIQKGPYQKLTHSLYCKERYRCSQRDTHTSIIFIKHPRVGVHHGLGSPIPLRGPGPSCVVFLRGDSDTRSPGWSSAPLSLHPSP